MSEFPHYDPRASEMRGHHARLAELRQIRERVDYIAKTTPVFMSAADMACQHTSTMLSWAIECYERGIEAAYKAGATREKE